MMASWPAECLVGVGVDRVVYFVDDGKLVVTLIAAAHRRTIYRDL
jgi:mRNA-degrading endonuclease RelE of RelBE toxin-antitoxin system